MNVIPTALRSRREYNRWVANETLEDFALRYTAQRARRWSITRIANTALGTASFLVLELLGATIAINYGFTNSLYAIIVVCGFLFLSGIPISYYAAKYGVDIDLLTRGAGFGYIGSTISSLIYASFTFIFFALEAAIMAMAMQLLLGLPLALGYIVSAVVVIPLVTHGISRISHFQLVTQPLWLVLQLLPLLYVGLENREAIAGWTQFPGVNGSAGYGFDLLLFGAATAVIFSLIAQIGEQVDFLRFLPEQKEDNKWQWWLAVIAAGPGWVFIGAIKLLAGSFLAYLLLLNGTDSSLATDPTRMYSMAFGHVIPSPQLALAVAALFVILCQLKINVANGYAGSLAWSNFFSRLTHYHPGRVVWLVFNVTIALLLMELGVYRALEQVLQQYSVLVLAWLGSLVADLVINKPLKLSPAHIEFKRSHLYDINPVGVGSMLLASVAGIMATFGWMGELPKAMASFIAFTLPFITAPLIAWLTKGKYYLARTDQCIATDQFTAIDQSTPKNNLCLQCVLCENTFDVADMSHCPAYSDTICSLCCSLDTRCHDQCRPQATITRQAQQCLQALLPQSWSLNVNVPLVKFLIVFISINSIIFIIMSLIYSHIPAGNETAKLIALDTLTKVFFLLMILIGVFTWLYVLARHSQHMALDEYHKQTELLSEEILAHEKTHHLLEEEKRSSDLANQAKSRYVTALSHELRTPLNVILGYAQILEKDQAIPDKPRESLTIVRRNGEHLANMIEGLLEISKIEAGKISLNRDQIRLDLMLNQLAHMFQQQAEEKGLHFDYYCDKNVPVYTITDEKRLRQILMNLLSNAIKFTLSGGVKFTISYRGHVARLVIADTGIGIAPSALEQIFEPFERIQSRATQHVSGSGLGLAISRRLAHLMGAEISVTSEENQGTTFTLQLQLSPLDQQTVEKPAEHRLIKGYSNSRKIILVVDDNDDHRRLLKDLLAPLRFDVLEACDSRECFAAINAYHTDLVLLDIALAETNGWAVAKRLRQQGYRKPIVMVSANARELHSKQPSPSVHDDYLEKPVQVDALLEKIGGLLSLNWHYEKPDSSIRNSTRERVPLNLPDTTPPQENTWAMPSSSGEDVHNLLNDLLNFANIGNINAFIETLDSLEASNGLSITVIEQLRIKAKTFNLSNVSELLPS